MTLARIAPTSVMTAIAKQLAMTGVMTVTVSLHAMIGEMIVTVSHNAMTDAIAKGRRYDVSHRAAAMIGNAMTGAMTGVTTVRHRRGKRGASGRR